MLKQLQTNIYHIFWAETIAYNIGIESMVLVLDAKAAARAHFGFSSAEHSTKLAIPIKKRPVIKKNIKNSKIRLLVKKNQKIGIMGKTGSGKSTIIQMILGVIKNEEVELIVDGTLVNSQSRSWQNLICYVPQKIFILDDTLKNNILFVGLGKTFQIWEPKLFDKFKIVAKKKAHQNRSSLKWENKQKREEV